MERNKQIFSLLLAGALLLTTIWQTPVSVGAKKNAKRTKYYTISKKAGTYRTAIKVKVKVKKGYQVFYKTSGKFKKNKVIKSGKSKTFKIKKTTTLSLCAIKKSKKVTNRKLNKLSKQKKRLILRNINIKLRPAPIRKRRRVRSAPTLQGAQHYLRLRQPARYLRRRHRRRR